MSDRLPPHGYLRSSDGSTFTNFDDPASSGILGTRAFGINDSGQIVGSYVDSSGHDHGFLATPIPAPEPCTLFFLAMGLGTACFCKRDRKT